MKIVTLLGSPVKNGKTAQTLAALKENLEAQGHEVELVPIVEHNIHGCVGCHACTAVDDRPWCSQSDDAIAIFERMIAADAIVYASPIYCSDITAQLKALVDRHWCLTVKFGSPEATSLVAGKKAALLLTCGGDEANNAVLAREILQRVMGPGGMKFNIIGKYTIPHTMAPDFDQRASQTANQMALDLVGRG